MISNLVFFETPEDLEKLTGLTHDELWKNGFNLDDMDWGFCTDLDCFKEETYTYGEHDEWSYFKTAYDYETAPNFIGRLLDDMDNYCVGYYTTIYDGKYYFTQHHA